ncbi:LINE-1 retrotransposable element ORF2 protein [Bienertia sinuspersici]
MQPCGGLNEFYCTFIYAFNEAIKREQLWQQLCELKSRQKGPWVLMGDFNVVMNSEERIGSNVRSSEMLSIRHCMEQCEMQDLPHGGNYYTWCNKQEAEHRVYSKLDRVMGNDSWLEAFPKANAIFLPENISDHSPAILRGDSCTGGGHKPFKYFRMWSSAGDFKDRIVDAWRWSGSGTKMYCLIKKLKKVKSTLIELNRRGFCELQAWVTKALMQMTEAQTNLQQRPLDRNLIMAEKTAAKEYQERHKVYMQYLRQKAKCSWIKDGDENTALFHQSIKQRRLQNNIYAIKNAQGVLVEDQEEVATAFVEYYKSLLGQQQQQRERCDMGVIKAGPTLDEDQKKNLVKQFTKEEVKEAMFSIKGDKAPGPDGFGAYFYQDNWHLVGEDVCKAVLDFFENGKLLKEVNCTFLTMIPKVTNPTDVSEFRPIACCNTIYKCITKMLCFRLKEVLPKLIAVNQGAFVHGRYIIHNIMVCQDLVRKYGRANTSPSCMMKVDLRKAYDIVEWSFIEEMMEGLGFPKKFTDWVMECVSTPMFTVVINGSPHGFFKSARGLRQGDPISPLLFVMGMEYLSKSLNKVTEEQGFQFHPRCRAAKLTHLCFADDLILCCKGEQVSIDKMLKGFNHFSQASGLQANRNKTEVYTVGMKEQEVQNILKASGFKRGSLPFKYLGVPICSKRISAAECEGLVDKMTARIRVWSSRHISFAGRSTLINSVLMSIHQYWAQVFVLPQSVLKSIEQICRFYLWSGEWFSNKPGYVAWKNICQPKNKGGLGFKQLQTWNIANMGRHVWAIATKQDNLWIRWVHAVYLKGKNWWDYEPQVDSSWYWKKVCETKRYLKLKMNKEEVEGMKQYKVSKVYQKMVDVNPESDWARSVWSRGTIPKHRFCWWVAAYGRLPTADRLGRMGTTIDQGCVLCSEANESHQHLFFKCNYTQARLAILREWLRLSSKADNLKSMVRWINRRGQNAKAQKMVWNAVVAALIYTIWQARNSRRQGKELQDCAQQIELIKFQVRQRSCMIGREKLAQKEKEWLDSIFDC